MSDRRQSDVHQVFTPTVYFAHRRPGHPFVGRRYEYQPKGGDALWLRSKGRYGSCVGDR